MAQMKTKLTVPFLHFSHLSPIFGLQWACFSLF